MMTSGQKVETAEAAYARDLTPVAPTSPKSQFRECFAGGKSDRKSSGSWIFVIPSLQRVSLSVCICVKEPDPSWDFESGPRHFQGSPISALLPDDFSALFEGENVTGAQMAITDDGPLLPGIYLWCCVETCRDLICSKE